MEEKNTTTAAPGEVYEVDGIRYRAIRSKLCCQLGNTLCAAWSNRALCQLLPVCGVDIFNDVIFVKEDGDTGKLVNPGR